MVRRAVTLLEVMFALGVIAIGLLSVMAVIPIGMNFVGQGSRADRAARAGLDAVEEFQLRGMGRWDQWALRNGTTVGNPSVLPTPLLPNGNPNPNGIPPILPGHGLHTAFCIDPQFIAAHVNTSWTATLNPSFFPYVVNGTSPLDPRMLRITLFANDPNATRIMTSVQAQGIFVAADDIVFDIPDDKSLPPAPIFGQSSSRRQFEGRISWMATLVPQIDASETFRDMYTLSIVVFDGRDQSFALYNDINGNGTADVGETVESVVNVAEFYDPSALGGGEVRLNGTTAESTHVRTGDWLMLFGVSASAGNVTPLFKWYKVLEADEGVTDVSGSGSGPWERDVSLHGPDWPARLTPRLATGVTATQAALVKNVIAVYEKTIRLETSNLWSN